MINSHIHDLNQLFLEHVMLDMPTLQQLIPGRSKCSLFRDLKEIGYLSSYNKAGRYYTIRSLAKFDDTGIWKHNEVYFSTWGSLKATSKNLIDNSAAGYTHLELQQLLGVRVHNTLLDLVTHEKIGREAFGSAYLYTHADSVVKAKQLKERDIISQKPPVDPYLTIEILRAVIKYPQKSVKDIQHHLIKSGVMIKFDEVEDVFSFYDLGKKN